MRDLIIGKEYAKIQEFKDLNKPNEGCIRVYRTQVTKDPTPDAFNLQIRTHSPTTEYGNGVKRDMVATVSITVPELEKVLEYMKECERN